MFASASLAINLLVSLGLAFGLWAYSDNLRLIADGQPVCLAGYRSYDSIAAAQAIGRLDLVSFMISVGGLFLAFFAFIGFWMIRREALDEAQRCATDTAAKVAREYFGAENKNGTKRDDKSTVGSHIVDQSGSAVPLDPSQVSTAGAKEETGAANGDV